MRVFAIFGVLLFVACGTTNAAQSSTSSSTSNFKEKVAFAGITFQGGNVELSTRYPYTSSIVSDKKLNRALFKALNQQAFEHIEITPSLLDKTEGNKYALSLVIDNELVSIKKGRLNKKDVYVWLALVSAQLVMFDVESSQLVMSQALPALQFTDTVFKQPTKQDIRKRFEKMLGGIENTNEKGLVEHFVTQLSDTGSPAQASLVQFSVGKVTIEDKAESFIPQELLANNAAIMKRYIAHQVLKSLSQHQNVAVQPYAADGSILTMQGRFSGGEQTYTLNMPEPLYSIDYTLRGFLKSLIESKKAGEVNYYSVFTNTVVQQNSGRTAREIFNSRLKSAIVEIQAASFTQPQEWVLFDKALSNHINLTFSNLKNTKSSFFKRQGFSKQQKKAVGKQIESLENAYRLKTLMTANASVTINGMSKLSLSGNPSEEQKQQQIDLALYDGIVYYYQKNNPEYFEFVLSEIPKDIVVSKVHEFIDGYKLLPSAKSKQAFITEVRARFDKANFEKRAEAFSPTSNNDEQSSATIVAVELVRLHSESKQNIDIKGLTSGLPVASELSDAKYRVLTNYAELSKYTNGRFNIELLEKEYASTSQVNPNPINTAAESRASFAEAFSVVVLHEVSLVEVQEMLDIEYIVNTNSTVLVYNAISSELVETININNTREIAKNLKTAAQLGVNKNSKRIAQQIKGYLFKNKVQ